LGCPKKFNLVEEEEDENVEATRIKCVDEMVGATNPSMTTTWRDADKTATSVTIIIIQKEEEVFIVLVVVAERRGGTRCRTRGCGMVIESDRCVRPCRRKSRA
jgi:hypothetical protein